MSTKLIPLRVKNWAAKNDHNFSQSTERHSLDVYSWRVEIFKSGSDRRGRSEGRSTTFGIPEDYGVTRDTIITRDKSLPEYHEGNELRMYYSDTQCFPVVTKPGGYMFDESRPQLPFVVIPNYTMWSATIIEKLEGICIGFDKVGQDDWIIQELISNKATALIDMVKFKSITGLDTIAEFQARRKAEQDEEARLTRLSIDASILKRKFDEIEKIRNGTHGRIVYALENGALRIFSGRFIEKNSVTPEDRLDDNMYCKVLGTGVVNSMPYKDVCVLSFGTLGLELSFAYRYNMEFTNVVGHGVHGVDEAFLAEITQVA